MSFASGFAGGFAAAIAGLKEKSDTSRTKQEGGFSISCCVKHDIVGISNSVVYTNTKDCPKTIQEEILKNLEIVVAELAKK